jgi:hypothetical protein
LELEEVMKSLVGLSLVVAALFAAGLVSVPEGSENTVVATPFWELHGSAPAAVETTAIAQLRQTARGEEPIVVALRVR